MNGYEVRRISLVFTLVQEMPRTGNFRLQNQHQELMTILPDDHKAQWCRKLGQFSPPARFMTIVLILYLP